MIKKQTKKNINVIVTFSVIIFILSLYWTQFYLHWLKKGRKKKKKTVWSVSPSASHLIFKHLTGDKRLEK